MKCLISVGADINALNKSGVSVLDRAISKGNYSIVKYLLFPIFHWLKKYYLFYTNKGSIFQISSEFSSKLKFFNITQKDNDIYITTKGYGHGVGMSQYGALGRALEGYNYKDILKHYYSGVDLAKI